MVVLFTSAMLFGGTRYIHFGKTEQAPMERPLTWMGLCQNWRRSVAFLQSPSMASLTLSIPWRNVNLFLSHSFPGTHTEVCSNLTFQAPRTDQ